MSTNYPKVNGQQVGTRSSVVCDGEVSIILEQWSAEEGLEELAEFRVRVIIGDTVVHVFSVLADKINRV